MIFLNNNNIEEEMSTYKVINPRSSAPTLKPTTSRFEILAALFIASVAIAALIVGSIALNKILNHPKFTAETNFASTQEDALLLIPCSNETFGNENRKYDENTFIKSPCPETENVCSEFICGTDGFCLETNALNATCHSSAQCGSLERCDLTSCGCIQDVQCIIDADCGIFEANQCVISHCNLGQCVTNLTMGAECSSSTGCSAGFFCGSNCTCQINTGGTLTVDTYDIVYSNINSTNNPFKLDPPNFSHNIFIDYGDWCEVKIELVIRTISNYNATSEGGSFFFDFSLPFPADASENGAGVFSISDEDFFLNPTTSFFAMGFTFITSSTTGQVFASILNDQLVDTVPSFYLGGFNLIYKKLIV